MRGKVLLTLLGLLALLVPGAGVAHADALSLCGNSGTSTSSVSHVLVVVLENKSYGQVLRKAAYPSSNTLGSSCGVATKAFGASHSSASNYFALVAGTVSHFGGCASVKGCSAAGQPNLFSQLDAAGLTWRSYQESMPGNCWPVSTAGLYKIGHNPALFFGLPGCSADDLPVADLTAASGALYDDLADQTLPSFGFVTPSLVDDGEGPGGYAAADRWLGKFVALVQASPSYQAGNTLLLITDDEGTGSDSHNGEDCSNRSRDMAGQQESCHIPFFVVYPWARGQDAGFFDHYSVTRTVEDLFGLPPIGGAAGAPSLVGHFGIPPLGAAPSG